MPICDICGKEYGTKKKTKETVKTEELTFDQIVALAETRGWGFKDIWKQVSNLGYDTRNIGEMNFGDMMTLKEFFEEPKAEHDKRMAALDK